jgi:TolB-like protein/Tfp pilus assembly protein PilF
MYEMITGRQPFEGEYEQAVMYSIINEDPEPASGLRTGVPLELERIVNKCLAKDPSERYQQIEELIVDLKVVSKGNTAGTNMTTVGKKPQRSKKVALSLVGVAVLSLVLVVYQALQQSDSVDEEALPSPNARKPSIAVLSFTDMSPQKDQEYFCDGMAEELINALSKLQGFRVVSRSSAFQFKGESRDIRKIGELLNVSTILEGSVRKTQTKLRISAQLVSVTDGYHLWSKSFDKEIKDVFEIQEEISRAIVNELEIKLRGDSNTRLVKRNTDDLEAYDLYLKGRYFWNKRKEEAVLKGLEFFEQAIQKDSLYALAYTGVSDSYNILGTWEYITPKEALTKSRAAAMKAIELDGMLAEAHNSLAGFLHDFDWDWSGAEREFKRAIELNPGYATAHHWYSMYLSMMGEHDNAIAEARIALELDPLSLIINQNLGHNLYNARQYHRAEEQLLRTLTLDPNFNSALQFLGLVYVQKEMYEQAIEELQKAVALEGVDSRAFAFLGYAYAVSGQIAEAKKVLNKLGRHSNQRYFSPLNLAIIQIGLGDKDKAFEFLTMARDARSGNLYSVAVDPIYDNLRPDPRFSEFLKEMRLY